MAPVSTDRPTSFPKDRIKVLLLENIHPSAHELFRAEGFQLEVLKTALIAGGQLWERVAAGAEVDEELIVSCVRTKLAVVAADDVADGGFYGTAF